MGRGAAERALRRHARRLDLRPRASGAQPAHERVQVLSRGPDEAAGALVTDGWRVGGTESARLALFPLPLVGRGGAEGAGVGKTGGVTMPHSDIAQRTRGQAQSMRRSPTDAERRMWWILRSLKPLGMHFRRQGPIGAYIADFVWYTGKLFVEIDGGQHAEA